LKNPIGCRRPQAAWRRRRRRRRRKQPSQGAAFATPAPARSFLSFQIPSKPKAAFIELLLHSVGAWALDSAPQTTHYQYYR
jgi:hypothetical protein